MGLTGNESNCILECRSVLKNLLTVRNFLIQDISSDIQQYCRRIQHFCTSCCLTWFEYARVFRPSQYFLIPVTTVVYIIVYESYFNEDDRKEY